MLSSVEVQQMLLVEVEGIKPDISMMLEDDVDAGATHLAAVEIG